MHFGALRLGQALPCWPPKQLTLALLHHQPAPPTHAPPSAQDTDAPGRQGWKSVDLMRPRDSHWVEEPPCPLSPHRNPCEKEAPAVHPQEYQDPQTPKSPVGCLLGYTLPKALSCNPSSQMGKWRPREGRTRAFMLSSRNLPGP